MSRGVRDTSRCLKEISRASGTQKKKSCEKDIAGNGRSKKLGGRTKNVKKVIRVGAFALSIGVRPPPCAGQCFGSRCTTRGWSPCRRTATMPEAPDPHHKGEREREREKRREGGTEVGGGGGAEGGSMHLVVRGVPEHQHEAGHKEGTACEVPQGPRLAGYFLGKEAALNVQPQPHGHQEAHRQVGSGGDACTQQLGPRIGELRQAPED